MSSFFQKVTSAFYKTGMCISSFRSTKYHEVVSGWVGNSFQKESCFLYLVTIIYCSLVFIKPCMSSTVLSHDTPRDWFPYYRPVRLSPLLTTPSFPLTIHILYSFIILISCTSTLNIVYIHSSCNKQIFEKKVYKPVLSLLKLHLGQISTVLFVLNSI